MAVVAAMEIGWWWRHGDYSGRDGEGSDHINFFSGFPDRVGSFDFVQLAIKRFLTLNATSYFSI